MTAPEEETRRPEAAGAEDPTPAEDRETPPPFAASHEPSEQMQPPDS